MQSHLSPAGGGKKTAPLRAHSSRLGRVEAGDRLDLEIFLEPVFAPFAAVAGLLVAAEWRRAFVGHAIEVDVAGAQLAADVAGALDAAGGHVAGQAIGRV